MNDALLPIDLVYTWVDGADPRWLERYNATLAAAGKPIKEAASKCRYANHDELLYSLRSVEQFLPWVRRIFIVTDSQRPKWLAEDSPRLRVVDHKEIFPDSSCLPSFNSVAIEANLHRIPDLSEHYLYMNDDMLLGSPAKPEDFFAPDGRPYSFVFSRFDYVLYNALLCVGGRLAHFLQRKRLERWLTRHADTRPFSISLRHTRLTLSRHTRKAIPLLKTHHTPLAFTRGQMDAIHNEFAAEYDRCRKNQFRAPGDLYFPNFYAVYGAMTGLSRLKHLRQGDLFYFHLGKDAPQLLDELQPGTHAFLNVNDDKDEIPQEDMDALSRTLQRLFPTPSSFEKKAAQ